MAKKIEDAQPTVESPYVHDDAVKQSWLKTKRGKLVSAIAGGVVILGATFAAGVQVGEHFGNNDGYSRFGSFGDRDHNFDGPNGQGFQPGGQNGQFQAPNGQFPGGDGQESQNGQNGQFQAPNGQTGTNG